MKNKKTIEHSSFNRTQICKCGNTYQSYSSLYTHIKNKHEGNYEEYN